MENEIIINGITYVKKKESKQEEKGYWFFNTDGTIEEDPYSDLTDANKPFVYATKTDCIKARDEMLALYRIKTYAEEQWGEFVPDWNNAEQKKRYVFYNTDNKEYGIGCDYNLITMVTIYFAERKHPSKIIEKFKDDLDILFDRTGKQ